MLNGATSFVKDKILIVEDEPSIREMLGHALMKKGYALREAANVEQARSILDNDKPDLMLLDWMLPGMSGAAYARRVRQNPETKSLPIIMLTARGLDADKVRGLDAGIDDYITKPFSTEELLARIRAVLRRAKDQETEGVVAIQGLSLDPETFRALANGRVVNISPTEFRLLHFFITHPERVHTRAQLLDRVWGQNVYIEERTVDVHIRRLRKTLEPHGCNRFIQTVRGVGYRFSPQH